MDLDKGEVVLTSAAASGFDLNPVAPFTEVKGFNGGCMPGSGKPRNVLSACHHEELSPYPAGGLPGRAVQRSEELHEFLHRSAHPVGRRSRPNRPDHDLRNVEEFRPKERITA